MFLLDKYKNADNVQVMKLAFYLGHI